MPLQSSLGSSRFSPLGMYMIYCTEQNLYLSLSQSLSLLHTCKTCTPEEFNPELPNLAPLYHETQSSKQQIWRELLNLLQAPSPLEDHSRNKEDHHLSLSHTSKTSSLSLSPSLSQIQNLEDSTDHHDLSHRSNYHYKHQFLSLNSLRISWALFFFEVGLRYLWQSWYLWLYFRCNWWKFWNFLLFCRLACKEIHIGGSRSKRLVSNSATIQQSLLNSSLLHTSPNDLFFFVAFIKLLFPFLSPRIFSLVMRMMMLIYHAQLLETNN